ncbi:hypothetical protein [Mesoterricola sediminis]|uniref:Uncharacterized protein n=1 Tax=Mesoterricola sediminis TaxID=2927980 RepID=A0AA48GRP1_9BACT|nr:hypothetical protein [Mesoterricola sediminis]BDU76332.1 hypothetical protein METESE_12900 [Mesoterricola sediminis]
MNENPYIPPASPVADPAGGGLQVAEVARAQRLLLISILASLVSNVLFRTGGVAVLLMLPVALAVMGFSIWCVFKLCKALDKNPVAWILAMFIPLVNLICLVVLNQQATRFLKANGVSVGLLGAQV